MQNLASTICGNDRTRLSYVIGRLDQDLQRCIEKAKEDIMFEIDTAINEYQEVRSRGEIK